MSTLKVAGVEIVNVDNSQLERLKKTSNTIDTGATAILEGLDDFAETLLARYESEPSVPYEKLFFALKQAISSGLDHESVRNAMMTGIISNTVDNIPVARTVTVVQQAVEPVKKKKVVKTRNRSAITKYAKTHTLVEIQQHFKFDSYNATKLYIWKYQIPYVKTTRGKKAIELNLELVTTLAKDMRLFELTRTFGCSKYQMLNYCKKHNIKYKPKETK